MSDIDQIRRAMEIAAAALDFERARQLRDQLSLLRSGATPEEVETIDTAGIARQTPGRMGLGTSQQHVSPPPGWRLPPKPDPMTRHHSRRSLAKKTIEPTD